MPPQNQPGTAVDPGQQTVYIKGQPVIMPESLSLEQRAWLRTKLGPEEYSQVQSQMSMRKPVIDAANQHIANQTKLGERMNRAAQSPTPFTSAVAAYAPMPAATSIVGGKIGGKVGERVAPMVGMSPAAGELIGGTVGGVGGGMAGEGNGLNLRARLQRAAYDPENPGTLRYKSPTELAQRMVLGRDPNMELNPIKGPVTPVSQSPVPRGYTGPVEAQAPAPPLGSPENPGLFSKIPTGPNSMPKVEPGLHSRIPTGRGSMPKPDLPGQPLPFPGAASSGDVSNAPPWTPGTAPTTPQTPMPIVQPKSALAERTAVRTGSAGDLASWEPEDLWSAYMKNRGTPQGELYAREIQRRGGASSPPGTVRANQPRRVIPKASIEGESQSPLSQTEQPGGETLEDWITRRPTGGAPNRGVPPPQDPVDAGREQYKRIIRPRKEGEM